MAFYSTIIRNALIFDGTGIPPIKADMGIANDLITFVGDLSDQSAAQEIDASGLYASPGFIDITNHSDTHWTLFTYPQQESLARQGITTIIGGNCGTSLAPIINTSNIADLQKWSGNLEINLNWQRFEELFSELKKRGLYLNFASFVGHGTLRRAAGFKDILYLFGSSLKEGALGLSTSLGREHSLLATDEEIAALFSLVAKNGGVSTHHLQNEGPDIVAAVSRIVALSRSSGAKTHFAHFKTLGRSSWPKQKTVLDIIEWARKDGLKLSLDFFPYTSTGSKLYFLLPSWALEGGEKNIFSRLSNVELKKNILTYLKTLTLHYEKIIIASTLKNIGVAGKSLKLFAENAGLEPEEAVLELLKTNRLEVSIFNEVISEENILEITQKDYAAISSDGVGLDLKNPKNNLPHPRSFGAFPRALNFLVKEKRVLSWESAIHKMSGLPADILGIEKRGRIKKGFFADIVLFSPENIKDLADYKDPAKFSQGVEWLFINGKAALADGKMTDTMPGQVILK